MSDTSVLKTMVRPQGGSRADCWTFKIFDFEIPLFHEKSSNLEAIYSGFILQKEVFKYAHICACTMCTRIFTSFGFYRKKRNRSPWPYFIFTKFQVGQVSFKKLGNFDKIELEIAYSI